jgi:hypothetical protein
MSHIPNSAMPHAVPAEGQQEQDSGSGLSGIASSAMETASGAIDTVMEKVRSAPKGVIAAGAVVAAGALAAAAIPLVKGARADKGAKKSGGSKPRAKKGA